MSSHNFLMTLPTYDRVSALLRQYLVYCARVKTALSTEMIQFCDSGNFLIEQLQFKYNIRQQILDRLIQIENAIMQKAEIGEITQLDLLMIQDQIAFFRREIDKL